MSSLPSGKTAEPWGHGTINHVPPHIPLSHGPFMGDASTEQDDAVSSHHTDGNREWPSGKAPRIGTRLLFPVVHRTGSNRLGKLSTFFFTKAKGYEFHMPMVTQKDLQLV